MKKCAKCKIEKETTEFYRDKDRKDGLYSLCKSCHSKICKKYIFENEEEVLKRRVEYRINNKEKISEKNKNRRQNNICKMRRIEREYRANHREDIAKGNKKYRDTNKKNINEKAKEYRSNNKEKIREIGRLYYLDNKDRILKNTNRYYHNNKEKIKEYYLKNKRRTREYRKQYYLDNKDRLVRNHLKRYKNDLGYRIAHILRSRIRLALKSISKSQHMKDLLGCDIPRFKIYLERQFKDNMIWDNYGKGIGKWNIDHITPCIIFNMLDPVEQKQCFYFSNLRPLWERGDDGNMSKNDKTDGLQLLYNDPTPFI